MGFFKRLFGIEDEIDYSKPLAPPKEVDKLTVRIEADTSQLNASVDAATVKVDGLLRKARELKKITAHGKRSGKPKSHSQKKPARKRSRK